MTRWIGQELVEVRDWLRRIGMIGPDDELVTHEDRAMVRVEQVGVQAGLQEFTFEWLELNYKLNASKVQYPWPVKKPNHQAVIDYLAQRAKELVA